VQALCLCRVLLSFHESEVSAWTWHWLRKHGTDHESYVLWQIACIGSLSIFTNLDTCQLPVPNRNGWLTRRPPVGDVTARTPTYHTTGYCNSRTVQSWLYKKTTWLNGSFKYGWSIIPFFMPLRTLTASKNQHSGLNSSGLSTHSWSVPVVYPSSEMTCPCFIGTPCRTTPSWWMHLATQMGPDGVSRGVSHIVACTNGDSFLFKAPADSLHSLFFPPPPHPEQLFLKCLLHFFTVAVRNL
jgi:hypothetical protein